MDTSVEMVAWIACAVIAVVLGGLAYMNFRNFKKRSNLLNRADEMTGSVSGRISEVVKVYRSNSSFRWKNEYPVITYSVGDRDYTAKLDFAEKRAGHYSIGDTYRVCYVPSDPSCCIVEEFRKALVSARKRSLIGMVVLCIFFLNLIYSLISQIGTILA